MFVGCRSSGTDLQWRGRLWPAKGKAWRARSGISSSLMPRRTNGHSLRLRAAALTAFGVNVWYDEYELRLGDSLSCSIDAVLARSDYGLVVLSKAFFTKNWPERELSGLVSREMTGRKFILPIWHQVGFQDVVSYSPPLANKFATKSDSMSVTGVAVKIIKTIRPDLFTHTQRRAAYISAMRSAKTSRAALEIIIKGPIRHPTFADALSVVSVL